MSISYDESATYFTGDKVSVTLGCVTEGASIYYTTDGTEPSATNGTLYGGTALELTSATVGDVTVKAIAVKDAEESNVTDVTVHFNRAVASVEEFNGVADGELVRFDFPLTASVATKSWIFAQDSANNGVYLYSTDFTTAMVPNYTLNSIIKEGLIGEVTTYSGNKELQFQIGSLVKDDAVGSLATKTVNFNDFSDADLYKYVKVPEVNLSAMDGTNYFAINGIKDTGYNKKGIEYPATVAGKAFDLYGIYYKDKVSGTTGYMFIPLEIKEVVAAFEAPVISVESGTYNVVQNVTLTVPEGTTVRYTTDDAVDLKEGTGYLEYSDGTTISILKSCTLRAVATDGTNFSPVATATYTMKTLEPSIDVEKASGLVTITPDAAYEASNVKIYYTTNGDTPVAGSANEYTEPFTVAEETEVKAIAVFGEFDASDVVNYIYSNNIAVEFTIAGGEFGSTGDTFGDITKSPIKLSFTTTGSNPAKNYTTALRFYKNGSLSISGDGTKAIKITKVEITYSSTSNSLTNTHISVDTGTYTNPDENNVAVWTIGAESAKLTNSGSTGRTSYITGIKVYYKEITIDAPVISLESGTYNEVQKVKLTMPEGATSVRYTTDDAVDLENGTGYTEYVAESEITIDKSCTLRAVATDGTDFSKVASATYTMKTVAPVITAADAVDGVFTNEDGFLNVTFTCPPYNNDDVIISYEVKDDMAESTTDLVKSGTTITVYGNATITATALYGSFDESDPVTATYKWNNPNAITFTKTGNIVIADQDDNKFIAEDSSMGKGENYTLTDDLGNEYSIYAIIGDNGTTNTTYPRRSGYFRLYAASGNAVFISNNTLNIKSVAITHNNTAIAVNGDEVNAVDGVSTWNSSTDECHEIKLATTGGTSKEYNNDITKISITFEKVAPFDKVANNTELLSMEAGKYYQVNVNLQGVKSHNGVLYARTTDSTVNPSEPGKDYFDSYEDSDYAQFAQHDWVAIDGLGSDYENKNITAGFVAQYDGTKLLPVNDVVPGSDETVTTNTFGVANVFYGNYENTDGFGYRPFFVKAKLNEVATFVAKAVTADEIQGSGDCGVINGKGLKVEGSDLTDNIGKYVALDGVLVADAEANGGVKVIVFGVGTPTGVDSAIAEGTVAIYGTEGAVSVTGVTGTVELYDATGRLAKVAEAEGSAVIAMPAGYYIVRASGVAKAVIVK
ncbi:MAG: chitobiase/beta-hexosaminidase C-terminal domain-containing protein [Muribaculaceae bacterium]